MGRGRGHANKQNQRHLAAFLCVLGLFHVVFTHSHGYTQIKHAGRRRCADGGGIADADLGTPVAADGAMNAREGRMMLSSLRRR